MSDDHDPADYDISQTTLSGRRITQSKVTEHRAAYRANRWNPAEEPDEQ